MPPDNAHVARGKQAVGSFLPSDPQSLWAGGTESRPPSLDRLLMSIAATPAPSVHERGRADANARRSRSSAAKRHPSHEIAVMSVVTALGRGPVGMVGPSEARPLGTSATACAPVAGASDEAPSLGIRALVPSA